jgi:hypothetical protein
MKQEFLNSLIGMNIDDAKQLALDNDYRVFVIDEGERINLLAIPNSIILTNRNGVVIFATAGDPFDLKN